VPQHHDADSEEQRKRNRGGDDQGRAQIAKEKPLQQKDQADADDILCSTVLVVTLIRSWRS